MGRASKRRAARKAAAGPATGPRAERTAGPTPPRRVPPAAGAASWWRRPELWIALALVALVVVVYAQVSGHDFVSYDDPEYVSKNPWITAGLTSAGVLRAFTQPHQANWHPLTTLSHMLDCQLFGVRAGPQLPVNLALHAVSTLLVFVLLLRTTGARWRSAFVAAVFAVHPLHVESVAWISERKDVLSGALALATMLAWAHHVAAPSARRYALALGLYVLAALAKPMVVTLPFVLLLLDYWPLGRVGPAATEGRRTSPGRLVVEKVPFFLVAAGLSVVTYLAQRRFGAVDEASRSLAERAAGALLAYTAYLGKTIWPVRLAMFYPFPAALPAWKVAGAGALLLAITAGAVLLVRRIPAVIVGWLWFLGMLVPVIGIVKVGDQAMADRFMYLPMVGLLIAVAWGVEAALGARRPLALASAGVAAAAVAAFAVVAWGQVHYWRSSEALFEHAIAVDEGNYVAQTSYAVLLLDDGKYETAKPHLEAALRARPTFAKAHLNMGVALAKEGRVDAAIEHYTRAIALDPRYAMAHFNLAIAFTRQGRFDEAATQYEQAVELKPDYDRAWANLGWVLLRQGKPEDAIPRFETALRLDPGLVDAHENLAMALQQLGRTAEAVAQLEAAVRLDPRDPKARYNLAVLLGKQGQTARAISTLEQVEREAEARRDARLAAAAREQLRLLRGS